jgi:hypothetical protein
MNPDGKTSRWDYFILFHFILGYEYSRTTGVSFSFDDILIIFYRLLQYLESIMA